jgi:hypothetical protein
VSAFRNSDRIASIALLASHCLPASQRRPLLLPTPTTRCVHNGLERSRRPSAAARPVRRRKKARESGLSEEVIDEANESGDSDAQKAAFIALLLE